MHTARPPAPVHTEATKVKVFGVTATVEHRTDHAERSRRLRAGLGHLDSLPLLDLLLELPAGVPLAVTSLRRNDLAMLRRAPEGVVRFAGPTVTRLAVPVVTPLLAVVHARRWRDGVERASEFAAYCPRLVVLREPPADEVLAEASWYGVCVAVGDRNAVVLDPEPVADWQPTPAWWRFGERVFRHTLRG